jgi:fatty acid desaturase
MPPTITLTDPEFTRPEQPGFFYRSACRFIVDERDVPFVGAMIKIALVMWSLAAMVFWPGLFRWWMAGVYWAVMLWYLPTFILMMHFTAHRRFFRREYERMNKIIPWFIGPFLGETPESYFSHHIGMHHPENNMPADTSSTMGRQRDSIVSFLGYFSRFLFLGLHETTAYLFRSGRRKLARNMLVGELVSVLVAGGLAWVNWRASLVVFVIPTLVVRFLMMAGNWGQHAFIDRDDPNNPYRNSTTFINTPYNHRSFNDGYHIGHHEDQRRHWTDMPKEFRENRQRYIDNDAVVFQGLDNFSVWFLLMLKRYDFLAKRFVDLSGTKTHEEIVQLLRTRTQRIPV